VRTAIIRQLIFDPYINKKNLPAKKEKEREREEEGKVDDSDSCNIASYEKNLMRLKNDIFKIF
jgi:hypothetical protein